jgi:protein-S-isoprenylcysteine O-methyltransferase Ste14
VAGLVPFLITGWKTGGSTLPVVRAIGIVLVLAGLLSLLESFARFVFRGRGTPAPVAPPTTLVVSGQYCYVRNPMYLAVVAVIVGQALWFASGALLAYAAFVWVLFHLHVVWYEESTLEKSFGVAYEQYRRVVRRWRPRVSPRPPGQLRENPTPPEAEIGGSMTRRQRARIALTIFSALVAGGTAGAGVGARLWSPAVAVALAVLIGLSAGGLVLRVVLKKKRNAEKQP